MSFLRRRRSLREPLLPMKWLAQPLGRRMRPLPVIEKRFAAARLVFIFGM